jgi:hypothetical protein
MAGMPKRRARKNAGRQSRIIWEEPEDQRKRYIHKGSASHPYFISARGYGLDGRGYPTERMDVPLKVTVSITGFEPAHMGYTVVGSVRFTPPGLPIRWARSVSFYAVIGVYRGDKLSMGTVQLFRPHAGDAELINRIVKSWFEANRDEIKAILPPHEQYR